MTQKDSMDKLQPLIVSYKESLSAKIDVLDGQWLAAQHTFNKEQLKTFYHNAHKLAGSAGIYGFKDVGQSAHLLEIALKSLLTAEDLSVANKKNISQLLTDLRTTYNKH